MKLKGLCISRPVLTIVCYVALLVFGLLSFHRILVRGYPNVHVPVITVQTNYADASPPVIESQVTTAVENQLVGISGLRSMHSSSEQGMSKVVLRFAAAVSINAAADEARNLVGGHFLERLPAGAQAPMVIKRDPLAAETLMLSLSDKKLSVMALTDYADRYLLPQLQQINGVADVVMRHAQHYAMRIYLNPLSMAMHHITTNDLITTLAAQNINLPGGEIKSDDRYYNVFTSAKLHSAAAFNHLIIANQHGFLLRLEDVAHATVGPDEVDSSMRVDGAEAIALSLYANSQANPMRISQSVHSLLNRIGSHLPSGMHMQVVYDHSTFLKAALHSVYMDLLIAVLLVILIVYLSLGRWRAAVIPLVTIPICMLGVLSYMYWVGYSINIFTLLALVLAVGCVVDDAIVMLENITRHIESGKKPLAAALKGSGEISFAIVAMTLTLAAVYAPIAFAGGMTGVIFRQFAFTLAAAVFISGAVALTLSPMMCAYVLKKTNGSLMSHYSEHLFFRLKTSYRGILMFALKYRAAVVVAVLVLSGVGIWCYTQLSSTLVPAEDMGVFMLRISPPPNASFSDVNRYSRRLGHVLQAYPDVEHVLLSVHPPKAGRGIVVLKPWASRNLSDRALMHKIMHAARAHMPSAKLSAFSPGTIGGGGQGGDSLRVSIVSNESYSKINHQVKALMNRLATDPQVAQVSSNLQLNNLQYNVHIRRNLAASLDVDPLTIASTIGTMLGGSKSGQFDWQNRQYDVMLQLPRRELKNLDILNRMYVRSRRGQMIAVANLATVHAEVLPSFLPHQDRMRADTIEIQAEPGYSMSQVVAHTKQLMQRTLPAEYSYRFRGLAHDMLQAYRTQMFIFVMAVLFIYLVLCALFESFIDPFIILLSVPMAMMGAVVTLYLTGQVLSIYATIGFVTIVGLIAKHGILMTEFANAERRHGLGVYEAIVKAASCRLRPILMTTLAMVISAIPLAFAHGAHAKALQALGWVVLGGMLVGSFFSLLVVPVAYSFFSPWRKIKPMPQKDLKS